MKNVARLAGLAALTVSSACHAEWTLQQASSYQSSCVAACTKKGNDNPRCETYCRCTLDGTRRQFPDYAKLENEILVQKNAARIAAFQAVIDGCAVQVYGKTGDRLKLD